MTVLAPTQTARPKPKTSKRVFKRREDGENELRCACKANWHNLATQLVKRDGVDVECGRKDIVRKSARARASPFILAAQAGGTETLTRLLELGADLRQIDQTTGRNALHWACKRGHFEAIRFLIARGLDPCKPDASGCTCLMLAAWWGHLKVCKFLLTGPAASSRHVNLRDNIRGWTALFGAARNSQTLIVDLLLSKNIAADPDILDRAGRPALLLCTDATTVSRLLLAGASCVAVDPGTGRTALHWAAEMGDLALVDMIIEHIVHNLRDPAALRDLVTRSDISLFPEALISAQQQQLQLLTLRGSEVVGLGGGRGAGDAGDHGQSLAPTRIPVDRVEELLRSGGVVDLAAAACRPRIEELRKRAQKALEGLPHDAFSPESDLGGGLERELGLDTNADIKTELTVFDCERALHMTLARLSEDRAAKRFFSRAYCDPSLEALRQVIEDFRADRIHLVQGARLLERHVQFELSFVLSQIAKKDREAAAAQRKILVCERNIKTHHRAFQERCDELGILGGDLAGELQHRAVQRLPEKLNALREAVRSADVGDALEYFDQFRESQGAAEVGGTVVALSALRDARRESLCAQNRSSEDMGEVSDVPAQTPSSGALVEGDANRATQLAELSGVASEADEIDWDIDLEDDILNVHADLANNGSPDGDATLKAAAHVVPDGDLTSPEAREAVLQDLLVLRAFLRQRLAEIDAPSADAAAMAWLDVGAATARSRADVTRFLEAVSNAEKLFHDKQLAELTTICQGGACFQRMLVELEQLRSREVKSRNSANRLSAKRTQLEADKRRLIPMRGALEGRVRVLKADMEDALQEVFDGKPFAISGIAKFL
ncbi:Ankyrin repeat domain-containing protein 50 [Hondaea fermentalgiana]|uniref:Ankyrin repeat domain-containing protein 50 n=1 Tax=Hondaea fermentalgiana TaxID=2315210 RepID=A0A2R5G973_9STRA|nr:Ankyrin repeat domain-containing protein 50 [Hondaea fermentalgiana]|eukprot:GBG24611.1 Ankyrin repeat domain-containing protein 50 [Hondaea fermentalgiana]